MRISSGGDRSGPGERPTTKETVIIVHGTWSAPKTGQTRWYEPIDGPSGFDSFVATLDRELKKRGSPARVWAHCTKANPYFHWSGTNSWIGRIHAASELAEQIVELQNDGWLCHIIAHSHGGNVALEALEQIIAPGGKSCGRLVTLGTPFLDAMSPITERNRRLHTGLNYLTIFASALLVISVILSFWVAVTTPTVWTLGFGIGGTFILVRSLVVHLVRKRSSSADESFQTLRMSSPSTPMDQFVEKFRPERPEVVLRKLPLQGPILAIGSPVDEAWQVLHHMQNIKNPFAVPYEWGPIIAAVRQHMMQGADIARIHGAKSYADVGLFAKFNLVSLHLLCILAVITIIWISVSFAQPSGEPLFLVILANAAIFTLAFGIMMLLFVILATSVFGPSFYSAFLAPFRWLARFIGFLRTIPTRIATYIARERAWGILLETAMGMDGYRYVLPIVERLPSRIPEEFVHYENMPPNAEQRAINKRRDWIVRHLDDVSQAFAKVVVTAQDLSKLMDDIEQDQTLVHAAYYRDDECIARIADWIASTKL